jgi:hypothetical protein
MMRKTRKTTCLLDAIAVHGCDEEGGLAKGVGIRVVDEVGGEDKRALRTMMRSNRSCEGRFR